MVLPMLGGTRGDGDDVGPAAAAPYSYVVGGHLRHLLAGHARHLVGAARRVAEEGRDDGGPPRLPAAPGRPAPPGPRDRQPAADRRCSTGIPTRTSCGPRWTATGCGSGARPTPTSASSGSALGPQTLATPLVPPVTRPLEDLEPMTAGALRRFLDAYSVVPDLPVAVSLRGFARVFVRGAGRRTRRALARAVLAQLAVFHAPDDLLIAVCAGAGAAGRRGSGSSGCRTPCTRPGPTRSARCGWSPAPAPDLEQLLDDVIGNRPRFSPAGAEHATGRTWSSCSTAATWPGRAPQLDRRASTASPCSTSTSRRRGCSTARMLVLEVGGRRTRRCTRYAMDHAAEVGTPTGSARPRPRRWPAGWRRCGWPRRPRSADAPLAAEHGPGRAARHRRPGRVRRRRRAGPPRPNRDRLRVPIGVGADGAPVELDLKESAQDGMGPHGLLIGATGSGKSELLRTLVLGAGRHPLVRRRSTSCWSTSRAARRSPRSTGCRTPPR